MQQQKYMELKNNVVALQKAFGEIAEKVTSQHRLMQSTITLCKNFDTRIDILKDIIVTKGLSTEDALEDLMDYKTGFRRRTGEEEIQNGDVVWVSYEALQEGETGKVIEEGFPVRVGSNAIMFEPALLGKKEGEETTYSGEWEGKKVTFTIKILKAKARLGGDNEASTQSVTQD